MNNSASRLNVFVDECGTNAFNSDKEGVSHLFICVAVIVKSDEDVELTRGKLKELSKQLCGGVEIKSNRIGKRQDLRIRYLEGIKDLPFQYNALIINKDRILKDSGLKYKRSFYKYINNMLYYEICRSGNGLRIVADNIGGKDFMDSFGPYLDSKGYPNLFFEFQHAFANSSDEPLIQLADLIAGSLNYCFNDEKKSDYTPRFRELLKLRENATLCWPIEAPQKPKMGKDPSLDEQLYNMLTLRVSRFVNETEHSEDVDQQMQVAIVNSLFFARIYEDRNDQAICSDRLIDYLEQLGYERLSKQAFTFRVIGKIRDAGIILSGSNTGYRLALTLNDIQGYIEHNHNVILPMIARLIKAQETVKLILRNYDVLQADKFLATIVDVYKEMKLESETSSDMSNELELTM